jgi:hypothetical protein
MKTRVFEKSVWAEVGNAWPFFTEEIKPSPQCRQEKTYGIPALETTISARIVDL